MGEDSRVGALRRRVDVRGAEGGAGGKTGSCLGKKAPRWGLFREREAAGRALGAEGPEAGRRAERRRPSGRWVAECSLGTAGREAESGGLPPVPGAFLPTAVCRPRPH